MRGSRRLIALLFLAAGCGGLSRTPPAGTAEVVAPPPEAPPVPLPNARQSLKFVVMGDFGTGEARQYQLAEQVAAVRERFPFELALLVGDNLYGSERPQDFERKFEIPYRPLLDAGVKFYASLGNHDDRNQRFYQPFNMGGKFYYGFKGPRGSVKFLALDSSYPEPEQVAWLEKELQSGEDWKIVFFHHPLYSSGGRHGSDLGLRRLLEPLLIRHNVSVVFTGHDHFYERTTPQNGIVHFVVGSGGKLARGDLRSRNGFTARGFDSDHAFLVCEIDGDRLFFNAISRTGDIVDSGIILRRGAEETR